MDELYDLFRNMLFLPKPGTLVARHIDELHFFVITVTMVGACAVFAVALTFIVRYRRRAGQSITPYIVIPTWIELVMAGTLLGLFIVWWLIGFNQYVNLETPPANCIETYVTGKQWMWKFAHPNGRSSVGVLVVPRGRNVKLLITSRDVVHSFYVPAFRLKQDAVPGRYTTAWFNATHDGSFPVYCAEYCGLDHSRMWARVVVVEPDEYEQWLDGAIPPAVARAMAVSEFEMSAMPIGAAQSLAERGRAAAARHGCLACHTIDGQPHIGPTWLGLFGSTVAFSDGTTGRADESYLTQSMMDPATKVVRGFQPVMPTFRGRLSEPDAAAIVAFIKSLRDEKPHPAVELPAVAPITQPVPSAATP